MSMSDCAVLHNFQPNASFDILISPDASPQLMGVMNWPSTIHSGRVFIQDVAANSIVSAADILYCPVFNFLNTPC